jgi:hypothetical protein
MIYHLLGTCAAFSWWIETNFTSLVLFGEYPYPTEEEA